MPAIAARLQQCQNRLDTISEHLSAAVLDSFQKRLWQVTLDFNEYTRLIREQRQRLEEKLADQSQLNRQIESIEFWCDETESIAVCLLFYCAIKNIF